MKKTIVFVAAAVLLVAVGFAGGLFYQKSQTPSVGGPGDSEANARGPMASLTSEERSQLQTMTEEERQQFLQKKFGAAVPGGPMRGGNLEGDVVEVADDAVTLKLSSGTQTVYIDQDTVIASAGGAGDLTAGATVMVFSTPSADGVNTASCIVVEK
ncbi:MAG: DUF5666 domain-containing protein [Coriobacteriales bacterium]